MTPKSSALMLLAIAVLLVVPASARDNRNDRVFSGDLASIPEKPPEPRLPPIWLGITAASYVILVLGPEEFTNMAENPEGDQWFVGEAAPLNKQVNAFL